MKKITITRQEIKEVATVEINSNIVAFNYDYIEKELPKKVDFSVFRKIENESTQQAIGGSLQKDGAFTSFNLSKRQRGDGALLDDVYDICEAIVNGTIEKEVESTKTEDNEAN